MPSLISLKPANGAVFENFFLKDVISSMSYRRVGVYVDSMNIMRSGGYGMRYEVIRRFAGFNTDEVTRLNAYVAIDEERAMSDPAYKNTLNFILTLRDLGFKVIEKPIRWYTDDSGRSYGKANLDMEMALDIISQSERLDLIYLFTGDGDFVNVVTMVQNKGCRVELVAFANVSSRLRREVDLFIPGYLIPGLLPTASRYAGAPAWGEIGSRVRGVCTAYFLDRAYGFLRFIQSFGKLWITDTRQDESPYSSVFFLEKDMPPGVHPENLPSRDYIMEFTLAEGEKGLVANDMELVYRY
jgi:uncharacterized LabA/DUF88 family protein